MFAINEPVYQWYDKKADCRTDQHGRDHGDGERLCSSLPISNVKSSGTIPNIVVNDVMMIGRRRRRPASCMASIRGTPSLRSSLIASSFRMESLMMIPQVTTIPMALIRFMVWPHIQSTSKEAATSIGIQQHDERLQETLELCTQDKVHQQERHKQNNSQFSHHLSFEKKLPEKSTSHSFFSLTVSFTSFISRVGFQHHKTQRNILSVLTGRNTLQILSRNNRYQLTQRNIIHLSVLIRLSLNQVSFRIRFTLFSSPAMR